MCITEQCDHLLMMLFELFFIAKWLEELSSICKCEEEARPKLGVYSGSECRECIGAEIDVVTPDEVGCLIVFPHAFPHFHLCVHAFKIPSTRLSVSGK